MSADEATPLHSETPADRLATAKLKQQQREQGIHANGVRQGREARERELLQELGVNAISDLKLTAKLEAAHEAELSRLTGHHKTHVKTHGRAMAYMAACVALIVGAAAGAAGFAWVFKDLLLSTAAARGIEQRGQAAPTELHITDGDGQPVRQSGYARNPITGRPLHEPAGAP
jgi:hypothetical protein